MDRGISEACRTLVHNLCAQEGKKAAVLFHRLYSELRRNRFYRLVKRKELDERASDSRTSEPDWRIEEVRLLSSVVSSLRPWDSLEIFDHLLDPTIQTNVEIVNLIRQTFFYETVESLPQLDRILKTHLNGARKIVGCQVLIPARYQSEGLVRADVRRQQDELRFGSSMFDAKVRFQLGCKDHFEANYDPGRTSTTIGQLRPGMDDLRHCRGRFAHATPEDAYETLDGLAHDVVYGMNHDYREINDDPNIVSPELSNWASQFNCIVAVDDNFMMKMLKGGVRTFLTRTGDPSRDYLLDRDLGLLYRLISPPHVMHDLDQASMMRHLTVAAEEIERRENEILRINMEEKEKKFDRPAARVWLPRGL